MDGQVQADIVIETTDAAVVAPIRRQLAELDPAQGDPARELVTILTVTAAAITLASSLIDPWKSLRAQPAPPTIVIEVESGATLNLGTVGSATDIERFVTDATG